jgi:methylmalonyl-CoA decarboxylase
MPYVEHAIVESAAVLKLNNPERRNALGAALIDELEAAVARTLSERARVVVLRAEPGSTVWSAGHELRELADGGRDPEGWDDAMRRAVRVVRDCPVPVIALVEGGVWGGATELVFSCDVIVATPATSFAITPAKVGVPYSVTGTVNLIGAVPRAILREMMMTARPLAAARAHALGIVNHLCSPEEIEAFTLDLARAIANNAPLALTVLKAQMNVLEAALAVPASTAEWLAARRRDVWESRDYAEGLAAMREKRSPRFRGE